MARGGAAKEAANDIGRAELKTVVDNRTVGEILSEARIARDMDYADVAAQLRIRRTYIEAIEDGRLGDLPGSTYAIGFVRTYAELMDLDVPKIVSKFKREAADFEDRTQLVFPEPMPGSRGPTVSVILIAILMLAGAYGGWLYVSNKGRDTIELVPPLPESLSRLLTKSSVGETPDADALAPVTTATDAAAPETPAVAATAEAEQTAAPTIVNETIVSAAPQTATEAMAVTPVAEPPSTDAQTTETQTAETTAAATAVAAASAEQAGTTEATQPERAAVAETVQQQAETVVAPVVQQAQETVAAADASQQIQEAAPAALEPVQQQAAAEETELPTVGGSQPAAFGSDNGVSRIVIRATSPSWVEITAADGKVLLNRLLRTGDTFRVPDQSGIKLVTGSAGGLEFTVDGKIAPKIGAVGDVRRDVLLEPDALLKTQ